MSLAALRQQIASLLPPPRAGGGAIPTGLTALDRVLSDGGLPCGRLTEVTGALGAGRTTFVRQLVTAAVAARRWVAVIDGSRTLAPRDWVAAGDSGRLWIVRPPQADRSAWCADILLRSGVFSLVVIDGAPPFIRPVAVRLTRLAQEHDAVLVVAGDGGSSVIGSAVRLRLERRVKGQGSRTGHTPRPASRVPRPDPSPLTTLRVNIDKGGTHQSVEVSCAIDMARRLCAHPEVPDRRGVATRNRRGDRVASPHRRDPDGATGSGQRADRERQTAEPDGCHESDSGERTPAAGSTLPRKRRCAEPIVRRDEFLLAR